MGCGVRARVARIGITWIVRGARAPWRRIGQVGFTGFGARPDTL